MKFSAVSNPSMMSPPMPPTSLAAPLSMPVTDVA
jgi:hypothetical protein